MRQADRGRGAGRHGHGRPAVHQPARGPPVVRARPGSPPASARRASATRTRRPGGSRRPSPRGSPSAPSSPRAPGSGPRARLLGARRRRRRRARAGVRGRRPRRRQQRAQPPHGPRRCRCSCPRSTPTTSRCSRAGAAARRQGRDRHQPQLLDGRAHDGPRAAARLRPALVPRQHDAGGLRRRLPRRALARHPRQRHPVHLAARRRRSRPRRRRSSARSPARRSSRTRCAVSAHTNRVPVRRRPHRDGLGGARRRSRTLAELRAAIDGFSGRAAAARAAVGAGAAARLPRPAEPPAAALRRRPRGAA